VKDKVLWALKKAVYLNLGGHSFPCKAIYVALLAEVPTVVTFIMGLRSMPSMKDFKGTKVFGVERRGSRMFSDHGP
jgi:hypothetical protein